jgi:hypothetical protein
MCQKNFYHKIWDAILVMMEYVYRVGQSSSCEIRFGAVSTVTRGSFRQISDSPLPHPSSL